MGTLWGRFKRMLAGLVLAGAVVVVVLVVRSPAFAALTKSKAPFASHGEDVRVRYEPGAESFADALAPYLDSAVARVETFHGGTFLEPFEVFVCATQASLNEFAGIPPGMPIRGAVLFGNVFIAPSAFDWQGRDTHRESLTHELSHLYLRQHLGFVAQRKNVPSWFQEGLADMVAGSGGEGITAEEAVAAVLNGPALRPDSTGALFSSRRVGDYGLPGPMLHKQSTMFLTWVHDSDPAAFQRFLSQLLDEGTFAGPFRRHVGAGVGEAWNRFEATLRHP